MGKYMLKSMVKKIWTHEGPSVEKNWTDEGPRKI
jgi:hypothetical protein